MSDSSPLSTSLAVHCATCDHTQQMPLSYSGRTVKCARCGSKLRAPVDPATEKARADKLDAVVSSSLSAAATLTSIIVTTIVALIALASLAASMASENPVAFPAACIFWAIVFSAWTINDKLNSVINILRSRDK